MKFYFHSDNNLLRLYYWERNVMCIRRPQNKTGGREASVSD